MKQVLQLKLAQVLIKILARLSDNPLVYEQTLDTSMKALNALFGTSAVQSYLTSQETYLKQEIVNAFLGAKTPRADFVAGRLHELQLFQEKLKAGHAYVQKIKRDALSERK